MKLFGIDFGKSETKAAQPGLVAPGTLISYDPQLIERFADHHQELLAVVAKLRDTASGKNFPEASTCLHRFKTLLHHHLLEENVRLYTYLGYCLKEDTEEHGVIKNMRREMGEIGRKVTRFIKTYDESGLHAGNVDDFLGDLDTVATALADRINREENSLYPLYQPPAELCATPA